METNPNVFECRKCDKKFAVGINYYYLKHYTEQGLTEDQAFEEYVKYLRGLGANIIHLRKNPDNCPYCGEASMLYNLLSKQKLEPKKD